jgi:hypothetical protein
MRRQHDVGQRAKLALLRERLVLKHIEAGGRHLAGLQRGNERGFLDDAAAGAVEQAHAFPAFCQRRLVDEIVRRIRQRHVNRDVVGLHEQLVERHHLNLHRLRPARREIGIVGQDAHAERLRALGDFGADAAQPDDAERLAEKLAAGEMLAIPLSGPHRGRGLRHGTGAAEDVRERQLRRGNRVAGRGVHHDDPALGGRFDVDVVHAHARATDHLQQWRRGKHLGGDLRFRADGDRVHVPHEFQQLGRSRAVGLNDLEARLLAQVGDALG